ncbi:MAG: NAD(P)-dependent oxidoreductase [Flavobacteriales bacterium]|nr:NAD(P)-dependent oxidoreductase [Flavobacteriales bacterium]NQX98064.1 NAD(P)-dependent oxidoreductase [Flavobacteriales bacterium]
MKKTVTIIGGGPAAMLLASHLDSELFNVTIFERNKALGRKFLVAGKGGFNLTHSENLEQFITRYTPSEFLIEALTVFNNNDLRAWLKSFDIPTFIGSSKRIYPEKGIKPIEVLTTILDDLKQKGVQIKTEQNWLGWNDKKVLVFESGLMLSSDITIFSLGGSSWKKTGSSGEWATYFSEKGVNIIPFEASNCAYEINWKNDFIDKNEGKPLKNIIISCKNNSKKGEIVITRFGLEGGAIYALSPEIRNQLNQNKKAEVTIDLKPSLTVDEIISKLSSEKLTQQLVKTIKLEKPKIDLLKHYLSREEFLDIKVLANAIKNFRLEIVGSAPLDEAISTVGGIDLNEISSNFELNKLPNNYTIGEMLNYDAPTGGYLLQSCFSMGVFLANHLNKRHG